MNIHDLVRTHHEFCLCTHNCVGETKNKVPFDNFFRPTLCSNLNIVTLTKHTTLQDTVLTMNNMPHFSTDFITVKVLCVRSHGICLLLYSLTLYSTQWLGVVERHQCKDCVKLVDANYKWISGQLGVISNSGIMSLQIFIHSVAVS